MTSTLRRFKNRALKNPAVKKSYDNLADEFAFLDEILKARAKSGLTQAEVAVRIGTTQSAIARLESAEPNHSPSIATLHRYAKALGYRVQLRFVRPEKRTALQAGRAAKMASRRSARSA